MRVRLGALWRTAGFGVRLLATFLLALAAIAAVQYRLVLTDTQAWALAERVEIHAAGAHTLNDAFVNPPEGLGRVEALRRELGVIADRPGIGQAVLVGDGGAVLTASQGADGIDPADQQAVADATGERRGAGRVQPGEGRVQAVQGCLLGKPLELPAALPEVGSCDDRP